MVFAFSRSSFIASCGGGQRIQAEPLLSSSLQLLHNHAKQYQQEKDPKQDSGEWLGVVVVVNGGLMNHVLFDEVEP